MYSEVRTRHDVDDAHSPRSEHRLHLKTEQYLQTDI